MNTFMHIFDLEHPQTVETTRVGETIDLILRAPGVQQTTFLSIEAARAIVIALAGQLHLLVDGEAR